MITGLSDYQINKAIRDVISQGLSDSGLSGIDVKQLYQPRQSGLSNKPILYFFKIAAPRYGYPKLSDHYSTETGDFDHSETIWRTPTYQVTGYAPQKPKRSNVRKPKYFRFGIDSAAFERGIFKPLPLATVSNDRNSNPVYTLNPETMTASDMTEAAASIMQTSKTRNILLKIGIGIIRITDIRQNYFTNEQGRYEQNPSFDFTISYRSTLTSKAKPVNTYELETAAVL